MTAYAPVWAEFLQERDFDEEVLGRIAAGHLEKTDRSLARLENQGQTLWGWNVRGIIRNNGGVLAVQEMLFDLHRALLALHRRGESSHGIQVFDDALRLAAPSWGITFGARAFGALFFLAASRSPGMLKSVTRKVSFSWEEDGEHVLEFKQGGAE